METGKLTNLSVAGIIFHCQFHVLLLSFSRNKKYTWFIFSTKPLLRDFCGLRYFKYCQSILFNKFLDIPNASTFKALIFDTNIAWKISWKTYLINYKRENVNTIITQHPQVPLAVQQNSAKNKRHYVCRCSYFLDGLNLQDSYIFLQSFILFIWGVRGSVKTI